MTHRRPRRQVIHFWWIPDAIYGIRRQVMYVRSLSDVLFNRTGVDAANPEEIPEPKRLPVPFRKTRQWLGSNAP